MTHRKRCTALIMDGSQCMFRAKIGADYCGVHAPRENGRHPPKRPRRSSRLVESPAKSECVSTARAHHFLIAGEKREGEQDGTCVFCGETRAFITTPPEELLGIDLPSQGISEEIEWLANRPL